MQRDLQITATENPPSGYAKGRKRREAIINAAYEYFSIYGYQESSLRDISASIGVTHAGLRYHFEAKEELLVAVLQKYANEYDQILSPAVIAENLEANDPWATVEAFCQSIRYGLSKPGFVRLFNSQALLSSQPENLTYEFFSQRIDALRDTYTLFLEQLQSQGVLLPHLNVARLGTILLGTVDGLYLQHLIRPEKGDIIAHLHLFLRALIHQDKHDQLDIAFELAQCPHAKSLAQSSTDTH